MSEAALAERIEHRVVLSIASLRSLPRTATRLRDLGNANVTNARIRLIIRWATKRAMGTQQRRAVELEDAYEQSLTALPFEMGTISVLPMYSRLARTPGQGIYSPESGMPPSEAGNYKNESHVTGSTSSDTVQHSQWATLRSPRPDVGNFRLRFEG